MGKEPEVTLLGNTIAGACLRIALDGTQDHIFKYGEGTELSMGDYLLKGEQASIIRDKAGLLKKIFVANGQLLSDNHGTHILVETSYYPKTFEAVYKDSALSLYGGNLSGLKIYAPGIDTGKITLNDLPIKAVKSGDFIIITDSDTVFNKGDVNGDKNVTISDALLAAKTNVRLTTLTSEQLISADVNGDGKVTAYDSGLIMQKALGLIKSFEKP